MSSPPRRAVLLADGDAAIRSLLAAIVARMELEAVVVRDGEAAAALLAEREFGAAVIDFLLPLLPAEAIVSRLAADKPHMIERTIVITTLPPRRAAASCAGVAAILRKPFALDDIQDAIRQCCDR